MHALQVGENGPVPLHAPTEQMRAWLDVHLAESAQSEPVWGDVGFAGVRWLPAVNNGTAPPPAIGQLVWPLTGLSRWAYGHFLIESASLRTLREQMRADDPSTSLVTFYFNTDDAANTDQQGSFTAPMYVVGVKPVAQCSGGSDLRTDEQAETGDDLYLLTLVDARYFYARGAFTGTVNPTTSSYSALLASLFTKIVGPTPTTPGYASHSAAPTLDTPATKRYAANHLQGLAVAGLDALVTMLGGRYVFQPFGSAPSVEFPGSGQTARYDAFKVTANSLGLAGGYTDTKEVRWASPLTARIVKWKGDDSLRSVYDFTNPTPADVSDDAQATAVPTWYAETPYTADAATVDEFGNRFLAYYGFEGFWPFIGAVRTPIATNTTIYHDLVVVQVYGGIPRTVVSSRRAGVDLVGFPTGPSDSLAAVGVANELSCGWLYDIGVNKIFYLTVAGAIGRCGCIDGTQGDDTDLFRVVPAVGDVSEPHATYEAVRVFETCCGCGRLTLSFDFNQKDPRDIITGTLEVNKGCTPETAFVETLGFGRCGEDLVTGAKFFTLIGRGPKDCDGEAADNCDNTYEIRFDCVPCDLTNERCEACYTESPPVYFIVPNNGSGEFEGDYEPYKVLRAFRRNPVDPCEWSAECPELELTATLTLTAQVGCTTASANLTYSGISADLVYTLDAGFAAAVSAFDCLGVNTGFLGTLVIVGSPPTGAPVYLGVRPFQCPSTPLFVCPGDYESYLADIGAALCVSVEGYAYDTRESCGDNFFGPCDFGGTFDLVDDVTGPGVPGYVFRGTGVDCSPIEEILFVVKCDDLGWYFQGAGFGSSGGNIYRLQTSDTVDGFPLTSGPQIRTPVDGCGGTCDEETFESFTSITVTRGACAESFGLVAHREEALRVVSRVALPLVRPPCSFEGADVISRCTSCGGNSLKAESRHLRSCSHPSNPTGRCSRTYTAPETDRWACDDCEHYSPRTHES